jgi:hypothetical protein
MRPCTKRNATTSSPLLGTTEPCLKPESHQEITTSNGPKQPEGYQAASVRSRKDSFLPPSHSGHPRFNSYDDLHPTSLRPQHSYCTVISAPGTARSLFLFLDNFMHRTKFSIALLLRERGSVRYWKRYETNAAPGSLHYAR